MTALPVRWTLVPLARVAEALAVETSPGHPAYGADPVAACATCRDVVCLLGDGTYAVVALSWSWGPGEPPCRVLGSWDAVVAEAARHEGEYVAGLVPAAGLPPDPAGDYRVAALDLPVVCHAMVPWEPGAACDPGLGVRAWDMRPWADPLPESTVRCAECARLTGTPYAVSTARRRTRRRCPQDAARRVRPRHTGAVGFAQHIEPPEGA